MVILDTDYQEILSVVWHNSINWDRIWGVWQCLEKRSGVKPTESPDAVIRRVVIYSRYVYGFTDGGDLGSGHPKRKKKLSFGPKKPPRIRVKFEGNLMNILEGIIVRDNDFKKQ